jgi:hypothetical protein
MKTVPFGCQAAEDSPFIAIAFAVDVKVRTGYFLVVGVTMRRPVKVKAHKNYRLARSILVGRFGQLYLAARQIQHKILPLIKRGEGIASLPPGSGKSHCLSSTRCFSIAMSASASACEILMSAIKILVRKTLFTA